MRAKKQVDSGRRAPIVGRASIERRIYFVRKQKVMIDNDLPIFIGFPRKPLIKRFAAIWRVSRRISCSNSPPMRLKT